MSSYTPTYDIPQQHGIYLGDPFNAHSEHVNVHHPPSFDHSNLLFHFFPLLPPELRQHIWNLALYLPRIIPVFFSRGNGTVARKRPTPIMAVNRESRAAAFEVQLSFHSGKPPDSNSFLDLNLDIDTLFLTNAKPLTLRYDLDHLANCDSGLGKVPKIAIPWETWYELLQSAESYWWNPDGGAILMETMKKIHNLGVEVILLVVSCSKESSLSFLNDTEIEFIDPTREFPEDESHWSKFLELQSLESPHFEWEKVALAVQLFIQDVQSLDLRHMMELRKSWIPYHCVLPTVGAERFSYSEGWTSPTFRFVEIKSVNGGKS